MITLSSPLEVVEGQSVDSSATTVQVSAYNVDPLSGVIQATASYGAASALPGITLALNLSSGNFSATGALAKSGAIPATTVTALEAAVIALWNEIEQSLLDTGVLSGTEVAN